LAVTWSRTRSGTSAGSWELRALGDEVVEVTIGGAVRAGAEAEEARLATYLGSADLAVSCA
jgi:hypothetical protein